MHLSDPTSCYPCKNNKVIHFASISIIESAIDNLPVLSSGGIGILVKFQGGAKAAI
jgi:hypothetical protein